MSKTIVDKLGLRKYEQIAVLNEPEDLDYFTQLQPYDTSLQAAEYDLIVAYTLDMPSLRVLVQEVIAKSCLKQGGYLFAAYPKKGNQRYASFIHRDELFAGLGSDEEGYIGESEVKFARMVGLDEVFTIVGFKSVARSNAPSSKASQRVEDYVDKVADIERDLQDAPEVLAIYQGLTPGYRKDWARYVYSAKQADTQAKRREEMKQLLAAGYKTREHYRKANS